MRMMCVAVFVALLWGSAIAKQVEIKPAHVIDRNYKLTMPMDCDWNASDLNKTMVYGYYDDGTSGLFQIDFKLPEQHPYASAKDIKIPSAFSFGLNFNIEFPPEMMEYEGMPIKRIVIDYVPIPGKRCQTGFGTGMMTK